MTDKILINPGKEIVVPCVIIISGFTVVIRIVILSLCAAG